VAQPAEHLVHVRVQLVLARRARDARERQRAAEQTRERSGFREQALRIERAPAAVVFGQLALERRLEPVIAGRQRQRAPDRAGNQQIALDVPAAPREELEAGVRLGLRIGVLVAVEHAQPERSRAARAEVLDRARGPPSAEDHRVGEQIGRAIGQQALRPRAQDAAVARGPPRRG
jgi:hypothetical protein